MAKENGSTQNADLKPILEAEAKLREVETIADQRRAELNTAVSAYLQKHGKPVTRKFVEKRSDGSTVKSTYQTHALIGPDGKPSVIPVDGGFIDLRMRRSSEGKLSGLVIRKNSV